MQLSNTTVAAVVAATLFILINALKYRYAAFIHAK